MNICPACVTAQTDPASGIYHANCEACNVRGIALSPKHIREHYYGMQEDPAAVKAKVAAEYKRIQRLKQKEQEWKS